MGVIVHNKLIRDKIPDVLNRKIDEKKIIKYETKELNKKNYLISLDKKIGEEINEYIESTTPKDRKEELGDVMEVIYAILDTLSISHEQFEVLIKDTPSEHLDNVFEIDNENHLLTLNQMLKDKYIKYIEAINVDIKLNNLIQITQIIRTIIYVLNISLDEFEESRKNKAEERGGFKKRLLLKTVTEPDVK